MHRQARVGGETGTSLSRKSLLKMTVANCVKMAQRLVGQRFEPVWRCLWMAMNPPIMRQFVTRGSAIWRRWARSIHLSVPGPSFDSTGERRQRHAIRVQPALCPDRAGPRVATICDRGIGSGVDIGWAASCVRPSRRICARVARVAQAERVVRALGQQGGRRV